jgi:hypothetical protein
MTEGPDLIVVESPTQTSTPTAMQQIVDSVAGAPQFDGQVVLLIGMNRFLSGGLKAAYECSHQHPPSKPTYQLTTETDKLSRMLAAACAMTSAAECARVNSSIVIADDQTMSWAFVFDMEREMKSTTASQHFHNVRSLRLCSSSHFLCGIVCSGTTRPFVFNMYRSRVYTLCTNSPYSTYFL